MLLMPKYAADIYNACGGNYPDNLTGLDILNSAISAIDSWLKLNLTFIGTWSPTTLTILVNCINRTLHRKASVSLPTHNSINSLCNSFSKPFKNKITQIPASCQVLLPVVILIFPLYITLAQCLNQHRLLEWLNWFYHPLIGPVNLILSLLKSCIHTLIVPIT